MILRKMVKSTQYILVPRTVSQVAITYSIGTIFSFFYLIEQLGKNKVYAVLIYKLKRGLWFTVLKLGLTGMAKSRKCLEVNSTDASTVPNR